VIPVMRPWLDEGRHAGDAGRRTRRSVAVAERVRMNVGAALRHASREPVIEKYLEVGFNYRMTDFQAAIGLVQFGKLDRMISRRRALAQRYQELLADIPGLVTIRDPEYGMTNYQFFWVLLPPGFPVSRDEMLTELANAGVSARRGIMAAHLEPAYGDYQGASLPVTEQMSRDSLILPLFHEMTEGEQDHVVSVFRTAAGIPRSYEPARRSMSVGRGPED
jgi:dTDP-4-amino-4,6-dideoxygalactose transaminase